MTVGPLLRREFVVAIGRGDLFRDRLRAAAVTGAVAVSCFAFWDWKGWDRVSVAGAAFFAYVALWPVLAAQACIAVASVLPVARAIASERDRKTLDALLATRLSGFEIVLGVVAAGLFRFANALAATLPVFVLIVYLGGVDSFFVLLVCVCLTSTALGVVALAVAVSVEARTASRASRAAVGLLYAWFALPLMLFLLRMSLLPAVPAWLVSPVLWALDSSPLGLAANLLGVLPRPWKPMEAVLRMALLQVAVAALLSAWAVWRLRPASRALYDLEGRSAVLQALRAANRSLPARRPCGANPVLWNEVYGQRPTHRAVRVAERLVRLVGMALLLLCTWWFAAPAFVELSEQGYGPSPRAYTMPDANPLPRVIAERLIAGAGSAAAPGQARLEFNLALRQISAMFFLGVAMSCFSSGVQSVAQERRRDTWLGLLATPMSGGEIIRGKVLGAFWRSRDGVASLLLLWTIGLASGAIHPLGFLAAVILLGASGLLYGAIGVASALQADRWTLSLAPADWPERLAVWGGRTLLMTVVPMALGATALCSYEDVRSAVRAGAYPLFDGTFLRPWIGARAITLSCLGGIAALAVWAAFFTLSLTRSFDALVGRPWRPSGIH